jgi:DNA-binding NarL/FixJ family response regulator
MEVLARMAAGEPTRHIASELYVSVTTVRNHVQHILLKLGAHSKLEAVVIANREAIIPPLD